MRTSATVGLLATVAAVAVALAAPAASRTCAKRKLLGSHYDRDDPAVRIEVYQDGKHLRTFRGRGLGRTIALTRLSAAPRLSIRVVFTLDDGQGIVLTRRYARCHGGPLHQRVVSHVRERAENTSHGPS